MKCLRIAALLVFPLFGIMAPAQTRDKRVTPVDAATRLTFEKQVKVALLVGVGSYSPISGLGRLKYPPRDVATLAAELEKQGYLVRKLVDSEATRGVVRRTLHELSDAVDSDHGTFLFYFSGHGFTQKGTNYLATFGATADDLQDEGLPISDVETILKGSHARQAMMFIDACRNDPASPARAASARSFASLSASQGLRTLYSTRAGQMSYESDELQGGVFTHFLVRGLRGEAAGADGLITFRDLADYLTGQMRTWSVGREAQMPYEAGESSGDFLLARSSAAGAAPSATPVSPGPAVRPTDATAPFPVLTGPLMVGRIDASRFAGLRGGDPVAKATTLFGKPEADHGSFLYYGDGKLIDVSVLVNPPRGDSRVTGAVVYLWGKDWVGAKVEADPLLPLIGGPAAEALSLLGSPSSTPRNGSNGTYAWKLPQGGELSILSEQGTVQQIALNWPKPSAAKPPANVSASSKISLRFSQMDVSQLAGLKVGDTRQAVESKYGRPILQSADRCSYGPDNDNVGLYVDYAGDKVKAVTVHKRGLAWLAARGASEPLLQLLGKAEAAVTAALGAPTDRTFYLTGDQLLFWGLSIDGQPLPERTNQRSPHTLTATFEDGRTCSSVGIRW